MELITTVQNSTTTPSWDETVSFSNYFFTLNSYVVVELWNQTYSGNATDDGMVYLGGAEFTITQLEAMQPVPSNVVLTNGDGLSPGLVSISWNNS